ncbi:5-methylcytosine restriction system specificity protein McrC [Actinokineospora fastidiosa]|uniref:5-methylcytosine-specific restriction enzyme subunit McrC n=1 Tax=Actinokineospora fastidiosa TaxID=1816 RepID=A0A918G2T7_9PSEU|nr:hypothetical protein [Actinokineospora fastidiosa]GGS14022.1 hypothetical protein GCM10010171_02340 [Actinokineospora fastidiosa]
MNPVLPSRLLKPEWTIIPCREYGPIDIAPEEIVQPDGRLALVPGVLNRYVDAKFIDNHLRLSAKGVSGLIPLTNRIAIQVRPRFPLRSLTQMVSVCGYVPTMLPALRDYQPTDQWEDWLLDVMTDGLLVALDTIILKGLFRTYHRRTETGSYPHGRINSTTTLLRSAARGINHRAQYSWFERTADNAPNRCLKAAIAFLHNRYVNAPVLKGSRERVARLAEGMRVLQNVTLETPLVSLHDPQVRGISPLPTSRSYYRPALDLAVAILTGRGINLDAREGALSMPTLLVRTEDLFEDFVRISLQKAFVNHQYLSVLDGNQEPGKVRLYEPLDGTEKAFFPKYEQVAASTKEPDANPDIVFRLGDGTHPLIVDVKYSNVKQYTDRSEVEQIVLYGHRYRSPIAMTIHPRRADSKDGLHVAGRIGSIIVAQYRIDLGAEDLTAKMEEMATKINHLIASQTSSAFPALQVPPAPA